MMFRKTLNVIAGCFALAFFVTSANGQPAENAEEPSQDNYNLVIRRWETTLDPPLAAKLSPDGKRIVSTSKDRMTVLNADDGKVLWETKKYAFGVFGHNSNELFARERSQSSIGVFDLETGKLIRAFESPVNTGIALHTDGPHLFAVVNHRQIVRYREGDAKAEVVFDYEKHGGVFGEIRRVPRVVLLCADEHNVLLTATGRLGIVDLATGKINVPHPDTSLLTNRMFQEGTGNDLFYTATNELIVSVNKEGQMKTLVRRPPGTGVNHAFLTRNEHLLVYSADTGEHQPAFICVHNLGGGQTHRIAWHSEEIGAIAPDASTTMFMTFNRIGQVAVWDISDASVTDNEDHSSPNNRTKP